MQTDYQNSELELMSLAESFWTNGFLHLSEFFDTSLMSRLQSLIEEHYGDDPAFSHDETFIKKSKTEVIPWFPQRENVQDFDEIDNHPRFAELTQAILSECWQPQYSMVMLSKAGTKGQAWHQDCPSDDHKIFNLNRLVYTMDINEQTGGNVVVRPYTHRQGVLTVGDPNEEFSDQIEIAPKAGDLILLHGHTWHKIRPTAGDRVSTNYRCAPAGVADDITDICVYRNMRYRFSTSSVIEDRMPEYLSKK